MNSPAIDCCYRAAVASNSLQAHARVTAHAAKVTHASALFRPPCILYIYACASPPVRVP